MTTLNHPPSSNNLLKGTLRLRGSIMGPGKAAPSGFFRRFCRANAAFLAPAVSRSLVVLTRCALSDLDRSGMLEKSFEVDELVSQIRALPAEVSPLPLRKPGGPMNQS